MSQELDIADFMGNLKKKIEEDSPTFDWAKSFFHSMVDLEDQIKATKALNLLYTYPYNCK